MMPGCVIVDLAHHEVSCELHGTQKLTFCCIHVMRGAPALHYREPDPGNAGVVLCVLCSLPAANSSSTLESCCHRCVDYHVSKPSGKPDELEYALHQGILDFTLAIEKGEFSTRCPYPPSTDEAWSWDLGWRLMVRLHNLEVTR